MFRLSVLMTPSQKRNMKRNIEEITNPEFWAAMNSQEVAWLKRLNEAFGPCELESAWKEIPADQKNGVDEQIHSDM